MPASVVHSEYRMQRAAFTCSVTNVNAYAKRCLGATWRNSYTSAADGVGAIPSHSAARNPRGEAAIPWRTRAAIASRPTRVLATVTARRNCTQGRQRSHRSVRFGQIFSNAADRVHCASSAAETVPVTITWLPLTSTALVPPAHAVLSEGRRSNAYIDTSEPPRTTTVLCPRASSRFLSESGGSRDA